MHPTLVKYYRRYNTTPIVGDSVAEDLDDSCPDWENMELEEIEAYLLEKYPEDRYEPTWEELEEDQAMDDIPYMQMKEGLGVLDEADTQTLREMEGRKKK